MYCGKAMIVYVGMLIIVILGIYVPAVEAGTGAAMNVGQHHLLALSDVVEFGKAVAFMPEGSVDERLALDPRPLKGWIEGRTTDVVISDFDTGAFVAMLNHTSYQFSSPQAAELALADLPDPLKEYEWKTITNDDASLLDVSMLKSVGSTWHTWRGTDDEGMPAYVLWLQRGSFISELHVNVLDEATGRQLFPRVVGKLLGKLSTHPSLTTSVKQSIDGSPVKDEVLENGDGSQEIAPTATDFQPQWWLANARARGFEFPCCWHVLAVWDHPQGHDPHFHGAGGDATTCVNNGGHGCINEWVWWLREPNSKLGVPKTWYSTNFHNGSNNANNYSATVWVQ